MPQKQIRWLLGELPTLLNEGVIDGTAAEWAYRQNITCGSVWRWRFG